MSPGGGGGGGGGGGAGRKAHHGASTSAAAAGWQPRSVIDRQASEAVGRLLRAAETRAAGATIKSLTLAPHVVHKKPTFAVTCQTLKYLPVLKQLLAAARVLEQAPELPPAVAYVLAYEALFGQGMREKGPAERAVMGARGAMREELARLVKEAGAEGVDGLLEQHAAAAGQQQAAGAAGGARAAPRPHPRWVRVNTLRMSVEDALAQLRADDKTAAAEVDDLLLDVLRLPPGTDLHDHPLVTAGALILQSKASCMPAHALAPAPGWAVLDACAAPGNKTTHAAARVGRSGRVLAFDKDPKRLARLVANAARAGAGGIISAACADFLTLDPTEPRFAEVRGIILDPSCSGSGTAVSRMDHLLPKGGGAGGGAEAEEEARRIEQLARFQEAALRHALRFPGLRRLAYSTCSLHARENEAVVAAVLPDALAAGFDLADPFPGGAWRRRGVAGSIPGGREARVVRTDPWEDGTDGFFVAVFERVRGGEEGGGGGEEEGGGGGGGGVGKEGEEAGAEGRQPKKKKAKKGREPGAAGPAAAGG
ncbi:MAG: S-adenosyl-L-methionine-dependent methyltransferase [Monoraphidium minutum]|nr:MAG: S-adenosyl-L-methionine-dependent methyltransferase [Monoraphidium minutum]